MTVVLAVVFWVSVALVAYVYAGYPLLLGICARLFGRRRQPPPAAGEPPRISVIIAARNEESVIGERVQNLLDLDYPADRLEILIASDGSTDRTCEIVRQFASPRVRLFAFETNRGKAAVLNDMVAAAQGEILLLSDANTMMNRAAASRVARWFADPAVGVVCGRLVLVDPETGNNVDGLYWKYETFLKECEARLGALLGANGAIYAMRRTLFPALGERIAVDDFVIPLLARLRSGTTIVYEPEAYACEETPAEIRAEFTRRSRIGAGGFQSLTLLWPLLALSWGWTAFAFLSHKVLRWAGPFFLLAALASSAVLMREPLFAVAWWAQTLLYAIAALGYFSPRKGGIYRFVRLTTMFAAMNLALLNGFYLWVTARQGGAWQRTARASVSG